jgi:release factor glutamine methyltransferase
MLRSDEPSCLSGHVIMAAPILLQRIPTRKFSPPEKEKWISGILDIYRRMRVQEQPYEIDWDDMRLSVRPNVYAPKFFSDSIWFASQLPNIVGAHSLLEIGTGTGIISIACAKNGARVVATDINSEAVDCARTNVERSGLDIHVCKGSLYEPLSNEAKFDFVFWAHPFNNWHEPIEDMLLRSGFDYHYEGLRGFMSGARDRLTEKGRILLGTGDTADQDSIAAIAKTNRYSLKVLSQAEMPLSNDKRANITYFIWELVPNC